MFETIVDKISNFGTVIGGGTPSTTNPDFWDGSIPWISPKDLTGYSNVYISHGESFITEKGLNKSGTRLLPKNTILFSSRAPIGYVAIADNEICTNQGFKSVVCDESKLNPLFFYYYIKANLDYIKLFGTGATFPEISGKAMNNIKIAIPKDVNIQKKIGESLFKYDEAIENNNKRIKLLEQMAQNLYKEWFVRFRFPGWQNAEFENGIPKGWHQGKLSELLEFKRGKNITSDEMIEGDIPVISAGLEPSGYHNAANVTGVSLTISSSGANAGYLSIHYEDIWAADCNFISEKKTKNIFYIYELLNNIRPVITNQQRGAAQPHVYCADVNRLRLYIPDEDLMNKANNILDKFHKEINHLQKANINLAKQRDLLLPRLMSGKLEVK